MRHRRALQESIAAGGAAPCRHVHSLLAHLLACFSPVFLPVFLPAPVASDDAGSAMFYTAELAGVATMLRELAAACHTLDGAQRGMISAQKEVITHQGGDLSASDGPPSGDDGLLCADSHLPLRLGPLSQCEPGWPVLGECRQ